MTINFEIRAYGEEVGSSCGRITSKTQVVVVDGQGSLLLAKIIKATEKTIRDEATRLDGELGLHIGLGELLDAAD